MAGDAGSYPVSHIVRSLRRHVEDSDRLESIVDRLERFGERQQQGARGDARAGDASIEWAKFMRRVSEREARELGLDTLHLGGATPAPAAARQFAAAPEPAAARQFAAAPAATALTLRSSVNRRAAPRRDVAPEPRWDLEDDASDVPAEADWEEYGAARAPRRARTPRSQLIGWLRVLAVSALVLAVAALAVTLVWTRTKQMVIGSNTLRCDPRCATSRCDEIADSASACAGCTPQYACHADSAGFGAPPALLHGRATGHGAERTVRLGPNVFDARADAMSTPFRIVAEAGVSWTDADQVDFYNLEASAGGSAETAGAVRSVRLRSSGLADDYELSAQLGQRFLSTTVLMPRSRYFVVARMLGELAQFESRAIAGVEGCEVRFSSEGVKIHYRLGA